MFDKYTSEVLALIERAINEVTGQVVTDAEVLDILKELDNRGLEVKVKPRVLDELQAEFARTTHDMPFIIRPQSLPLVEDRVSVRREEVHGGVDYFAYYRQPNKATAERVKAEFDKELGCTDKTKIVTVPSEQSVVSGTAAAVVSTLSPLGVSPAFMVDGKYNAEMHRMMIDEEINNPTYPHVMKLLKPNLVVDLEDLKRKTEGLDPNDAFLTQEQQGWIVQRCNVDKEYFEAKVAMIDRKLIADIDISDTYPKTMTLAVDLPPSPFTVVIHHDWEVDLIRSDRTSFFKRDEYSVLLADLMKVVTDVRAAIQRTEHSSRNDINVSITMSIAAMFDSNPNFKGVTYLSPKT